jgi:phage terminase small subunit
MSDDHEEYTLGEGPAEELPTWHDHDWTVEEVTFLSGMLMHGSPSRAYREAFMKPGDKTAKRTHWMNAHVYAQRYLAKPHIAGYLDMMRKQVAERLRLDSQNVLKEIAKLAFVNFADFIVISERGAQLDLSALTMEQAAAIQELSIETYMEPKGSPNEGREVKSVKVKLAPKLGALEALGRHYKLFTDRVETSEVDIAEEMRRAREERRKRKEEDSGDDGNGDGALECDGGDRDGGRKPGEPDE